MHPCIVIRVMDIHVNRSVSFFVFGIAQIIPHAVFSLCVPLAATLILINACHIKFAIHKPFGIAANPIGDIAGICLQQGFVIIIML